MKKHKPLIYALILLAINFLIFLISDKDARSYDSSSYPTFSTPTVTATATPKLNGR